MTFGDVRPRLAPRASSKTLTKLSLATRGPPLAFQRRQELSVRFNRTRVARYPGRRHSWNGSIELHDGPQCAQERYTSTPFPKCRFRARASVSASAALRAEYSSSRVHDLQPGVVTFLSPASPITRMGHCPTGVPTWMGRDGAAPRSPRCRRSHRSDRRGRRPFRRSPRGRARPSRETSRDAPRG